MSLNICDLSDSQLVLVLHFSGVFCVRLIVQQNQFSYPPYIYGGHTYDERYEENDTESLTLKEREQMLSSTTNFAVIFRFQNV